MKKANIYIDFGSGDSVDFGKKIKDRLKVIKGNFDIISYRDLLDENGKIKPEETWESITLKAIDSADIVIPILSADYITYLSQPIQGKFESIIESNDKFLFPILFSSSNWSDMNWVVKSKMTPNESKPIEEYESKEQEKIINTFIKTIENVVIKINSSTVDNPKDVIDENLKQIFISHDHDDADFAELLKLKLEKENLDAWLDNERLKIGQDWRTEIDHGIENSLAVIVIMTPEARKSEYVTYEWAFAWGKGKKVFPIMLKQTQLHPRLESLQYLDFTNRTNRPWTELIEEIIALKK